METMDMTPKWAGFARVLIELATSAETLEARQGALKQIRGAFSVLDLINEVESAEDGSKTLTPEHLKQIATWMN